MLVEAPESEAEFERVGQAPAGDAHIFANMVPTCKSPLVSAENLKRHGYSIVIHPAAGVNAACAAAEQANRLLEQHGSTAGSPVASWSMDEQHRLVGFSEFGNSSEIMSRRSERADGRGLRALTLAI